jgi:DNA-binding response OmpR family regulator
MARILIAEDERDIRELIIFTLEFGGFQVLSATNGEEAVELARQHRPDLIILDVRMPKMTGYEACRLLKSQEETRSIPVVFLSAKGQEAEIRQGMEAGADAYILKPFAPDELIQQVRAILDRRTIPRRAGCSCEEGEHFPMLEHPARFQRLAEDFLTLPDPSQIALKEEWRRRFR